MLDMEEYQVNGLYLPQLLVDLLRQGRWVRPGDATIRQAIPFLPGPVDFLTDIDRITRNSGFSLVDSPEAARLFHSARGSRSDQPILLPWLDAELAVFVAVNRIPGDDLGIALDYHTRHDDPRVVASEWRENPVGCFWRETAPTFSQFVEALRL